MPAAWKLALGHLWALPLSLVGLLAALVGGARPYKLRPGGVWQWVGTHGLWRRWYASGDWQATTLGAVTVFNPKWQDDPVTIRHEREHTYQVMRWGILWPFLYLGQWAWELWRDGGAEFKAYQDIPLERAAYAVEKDVNS